MRNLRSSAPTHTRGFTLLELLVTIAVAAILLAIAIPSYLGMVQRNTIAANANDLVGALNYARSQAVTRGRPVRVCAGQSQTTCGNGDWNDGWTVSDPDPDPDPTPGDPNDPETLRVYSGLDRTINVSFHRGQVEFDANGFARGSNGTFEVTSNDTDQTDGTAITIATSGRIATGSIEPDEPGGP